MDNREAKFILSAYRPGGQDANDPAFSEALKQVRRDPVLERWFQESVAFDAAVTEKFSTIQGPSGLRENILAGAKVSHASTFVAQSKLWAIAATISLAAIIALVSTRQFSRPRLAGWQTEALGLISSLVTKQSTFDAQSRSSSELIKWLQDNRAPAAPRLPRSLEPLVSLGCKTLFWKNKPISVICFQRVDGGLIHLVTADATLESNSVIPIEPAIVQQGKWATASWREGNKLCMLVLEGTGEQLRKYL